MNYIRLRLIVFYWIFCCLEDLESFRNGINYWLVLMCVVLGYTTILYALSSLGHIIACSLLGSFAIIAALSHYVGANLQYIVVNMFRRATIEDFYLALVDPPYQMKGKNQHKTNCY